MNTAPAFYAANLTTLSLSHGIQPWEFVATEKITDEIRNVKAARQLWYRNPATRHHFYSFVEPSNPNQRTSKIENPPRLLHGIVADYDLEIPTERVGEAIDRMKLRPSYAERSLGGKWRLVWLFERPIPVESYSFCEHVLEKALKWLSTGLLPGLDENAFKTPTQLYANGCCWSDLHQDPIPADEVQAFFVECGRAFTFRPSDRVDIPFDVIEAALKEQFPNFSWPSDFTVESQGPSFWVPGSESTMSAIVKTDGMFTFAGHATKPFYSWKEILGPEFCRKWEIKTMSSATDGCFSDGKFFWRKLTDGRYVNDDLGSFTRNLRVNCRLSTKPDKTGTSQVDRAIQHINDHQRVDGAAPLLFQPKGTVIEYNGFRFLNIAQDNLILPASGVPTWGAKGLFPFISELLDTIFSTPEQLEVFLAWLSHFYRSGLSGKPLPGQHVYLAGLPGIGKTLLSREIVGVLMGGSIDCRDYILGEDKFGGQLFRYAVWCSDDETISDSDATRQRMAGFLKKLAANQTFLYHQKYEKPVQIAWMGRVLLTLNLDFVSCRVLPPMDNSSAEKINIFRCGDSPIVFPNRYQIKATLMDELPHFGNFLANHQIAPRLLGDQRYVVKAYQEPSLVVRAHHTSKAAPFRELMIEDLQIMFSDSPEMPEWDGTASALHRRLLANPLNAELMRAMRIDLISRHLEQMERSGDLQISSYTDEHGLRHWKIPRFT